MALSLGVARMVALGTYSPQSYPQPELLHMFRCDRDPFAQRVSQVTAIEYRSFEQHPESMADATPKERHAYSEAQIPRMGYQALVNTGLAESDQRQLDALICVNSSALLVPGAAEILGDTYGIGRSSCLRFNLVGHGCVGAVPGLQLAHALLKSGTAQTVAVVTSEPLLALYNPENVERSTLVARLIFGEGAAAVVLKQGTAAAPELQGLPELIDSQVQLAPSSLKYVTIRQDTKPVPCVGIEVPATAATLVEQIVPELLARHHLHQSDVRHWAFHTGGRAVLDGCEKTLKLTPKQMQPSREILRRYGNLQSASVIFSLAELVAQQRPQPGDWGLLVAVGPGMLAGAYLLRW